MLKWMRTKTFFSSEIDGLFWPLSVSFYHLFGMVVTAERSLLIVQVTSKSTPFASTVMKTVTLQCILIMNGGNVTDKQPKQRQKMSGDFCAAKCISNCIGGKCVNADSSHCCSMCEKLDIRMLKRVEAYMYMSKGWNSSVYWLSRFTFSSECITCANDLHFISRSSRSSFYTYSFL